MAKEIALEILKILEKYSDKEHKLTKGQIMDFLCDEYDRSIEEKAFYRKIEELQNAGYKIIKTMGKYSTYYLDLPRLTASEMLYLSIMILGS